VRLPLHRTWATYFLLGLIGVVFLGQLASEQLLGGDLLAALGAKVNRLIVAGEYWRLVTPIFLHGGLLHFLFNMYALYNLGREVEAFMGTARFVLLFFYAGVAGTVFSLLFTPNPSLGASGAIFGLIGAQGVFLYRNRKLFGERGRRGLQQIIMIALINLAIGLQGNIDNWAHLGGLLGGLALGWALGPAWRVEPAPLDPTQAVIVNEPDGTSTRGLVAAGLWVALAALTAAAIVLAGQ
jgi:rhomboid protease GluP